MTPPFSLNRRNAELFVRHCAGDSYGALGASFGISRARAEQIARRTAARLASNMPLRLAPWDRRKAGMASSQSAGCRPEPGVGART